MKHTKLLTFLLSATLLLPATMTSCGKDKVLYYRYDYDLSDYITLAEYKGLPVQEVSAEVSEEDIQNQIQSTVLYFAQEVEVDRAAKQYDIVKFSCTATLDGEDLPDYAEDEGSLKLGFATYGEAVDDALMGAVAGDTVVADRTLSGLVTDENMVGKTITYTFQITSVCETQEQEYNDIFVKAYLGYDTVEEYEQSVRDSMNASAAATKLTSYVNQTWSTIVENTTVLQYPEKELDQIADQLVAEIEAYTEAAGVSFDSYVEAIYGKTADEFRAYAEEVAQSQVKEDMIVYAIARAENLEVTDEQYHEYAALFMEQLGYSTEAELEQHYTTGAIKESILGDVVKEFIADNVVEQ